MSVKKHDRVLYKGKPAKVIAHPDSAGTVRLHVGEGRIQAGVRPSDYEEIATPTEVTPEPPKPKARSEKPIAKARRQVGTGKDKGK